MRGGRTHVVYLGRPPMRFASRYATEPSYTLFVIAGQHQVFIPPVDHPEDVLVCLRFVGRRRLHPNVKIWECMPRHVISINCGC